MDRALRKGRKVRLLSKLRRGQKSRPCSREGMQGREIMQGMRLLLERGFFHFAKAHVFRALQPVVRHAAILLCPGIVLTLGTA